MVETIPRYLLDASILLFIVASLVQVYFDIADREAPSFLPAVLANQRPSEPATVLAVGSVVLFALGFVIEMALTGLLPGGRILVWLLAGLSFLFAGGFVVSEDEPAAEADPDVEG